MSIKYSIKHFDELTNVDIYYILHARSQVFVVEQNCVYQDIDLADLDCHHLVAHQEGMLIGYCRIIAPSLEAKAKPPKQYIKNHRQAYPSIGRLLVLPENRRQGLAYEIMNQAIKHCRKNHPKQIIVISAQTYLIEFYESLGFSCFGEHYVEDGIVHVDMINNPIKNKKASAVATSYEFPKLLSFLLIILGTIFIAVIIYLMT